MESRGIEQAQIYISENKEPRSTLREPGLALPVLLEPIPDDEPNHAKCPLPQVLRIRPKDDYERRDQQDEANADLHK